MLRNFKCTAIDFAITSTLWPPQSVGYYTSNWHKQGSQYSLWHL